MPTQNRAPISDFAVAGTWSGVVGSRYTLVATYPDPTPTDYLAHGTTAGNIAFGFAPFTLPLNAFAISVEVRSFDAEPSAGTNNIRARVRVGGAYFQEPTSHNPAGATYTARSYKWAVNPQTTLAWTPADINGTGPNPLQHFGLISTDANPEIRVSCIELRVTYQIPDHVPTAPEYTLVDNTYIHTPKTRPTDLIEIEIGDLATPTAFLPQFKVKRWGNEANVSIRLTDANVSPVVNAVNGIIEWRSVTGSARFYGIQPWPNSEDGGVEFEIVLPAKPPTNSFPLSVQSKNAEWIYQPSLANVNPDGSTWELGPAGRTLERSAQVSGSYAIYHVNRPANIVGGLEYKCGKIGHLFRPRAIDAAGTKEWGSVSYNGIDTLTVTIPQVFLDAAVYPVVIDPTFGYTSAGASIDSGMDANYLNAVQVTSGSAGTLSSMSIFAHAATSGNLVMGIYTNALTAPVTRVDSGPAITLDTTDKQWDATGFTQAVLAATLYWLAFNNNATMHVHYDAGSSGHSRYAGSTYSVPPPTPFPADNANTEDWSMFATYTAAGGLIPYPFSRGARGGQLALSGGLQ